MQPRPAATVLVAISLLAGCADSGESVGPASSPPVSTVVDPDDIASERLGPLVGLGPCPTDVPTPADVEIPAGLPIPAGAVVAVVAPSGPLTSLQGWAPRTPVEIMVGYLRTEGWEVQQAEDEVFESEVLLVRESQRLYVKAQAVCERASAWVAFLGTEEAPVPTPSGGGGG